MFSAFFLAQSGILNYALYIAILIVRKVIVLRATVLYIFA